MKYIKKYDDINEILAIDNIIVYLQNKFDKEKMKKGLNNFKLKILEEKDDYKEVATILRNFSKTGNITKSDARIVKLQLYDTLRMVGLGGIFFLPGGAFGVVVLIKLAKRLGINLLPSAWSNEKTNMKENHT